MPITIEVPDGSEAYWWEPEGMIIAGPNGPKVLLFYTLTHHDTTTSQGQMPTMATITADQWAYPVAAWQADLQTIGLLASDIIAIEARLYDTSFDLVATSATITGGALPRPIYPPPTTVVPDVAAAMVMRLKYAPQIQALCSDRVSIILKAAWAMPKYAIVVGHAGGAGPDQELDRHFARLDLRFFGPGDDWNVRQRNAMTLWRTAHPVLVPPIGLRISNAFHAAHCIVQNVRQDLEPIRITEPGTDWPVVLVPYVVSYMASAV